MTKACENIAYFTPFTPIQSPINYTGSKARLLPQILPLFPREMGTCVDLFCGGGSVGINVGIYKHCKNIIFNDKSKPLIEIFTLFLHTPFKVLLQEIESIIESYGLSNTADFGYKYYDCDSQEGLASYNKKGFERLKNDYNINKSPIKLFVLLIFSFNNQMRFNAKGAFNLPCGKRDFNTKMRTKLQHFVQGLQSLKPKFLCCDFRDFDLGILDSKDFVYIDPPYLLALASYNENGGWSEKDEYDLYFFMEKLDSSGARFAFSNVLTHKGREHIVLKKWLKKTGFRVYKLDFHYKNCNYQTKRTESSEVLVTNY